MDSVVIQTDRIVIVGAGLGGLYAALSLAPRPVLMISPETLGTGASSAWAQGGVAAAIEAPDSPAAHARDTVQAGAGTVDPDVAARVTAAAADHIAGLSALGTPFDRDAEGHYVLSREAAHSMARVVRVQGDQAGHQIMRTLIDTVRATPSIQVIEGAMATTLEASGGAVTGVRVQSSADGGSEEICIRAPAVLLAGGGSAGLYALTTNPPRVRGQVIGMAARAGAIISDAEFVQFHPTAIDTGEDPAPLATEALRGEGAILVNRHGTRFMLDAHPDAELAPRDVVARAIFAQAQAGNRPMLDTRAALGARIKTQFPAVASACARAGIDPEVDPIPVSAAAHYHMGGIDTDARGRASLDGLWVCGEASATGLHGANRLASNGLLEALVYARTAAQDICDTRPAPAGDAPGAAPLAISFAPDGELPDPALVAELRRTMTAHVGVTRTESGLMQALQRIAAIEAQQPTCATLLNMTATATIITASALVRRESRGGHWREDFPHADPALAHRSHMTLQEALALRARAVEESQ
ncbi:L-aspartate oxidase [Sediminimonas qiaohouensis]|uniref:L-aspartate oxidase n=1 Tax=Sediminimonas qiaohouensis TaxID=552061 RepID=UPI0023564813|nr:L-aspartate oxidase [Sediminimonas qiaohouensis]